jgi:3-hydroxyacyl-[acyl-carrier-protein] dehydratase
MLVGSFYIINELKVEGGEVSAKIELQSHHPIFEGHFPGEPVMPGVTMIRICEEILSESLKIQYRIKESKSIKFLSIINPIENPSLEIFIQFKHQDNQLIADFSFIKSDGVVSFKMNATLLNWD